MERPVDLVKLGKKICEIRKEKGFSQKRLAELVGVAQSTMSYIEKGQKSPTVSTLNAICEGLSVSLFDVLDLDDEIAKKVKATKLDLYVDIDEFLKTFGV
jgi:transcriptional regulator with XRE-family HTH domain